jgi:hypothetical protein
MRISEVEFLPGYRASSGYRHHAVRYKDNPYEREIRSGEFRPVTKVKGHTIYYNHSNDPHDHSVFIAVNDSTGLVDMRVSGAAKRAHGMVMFSIDILDGRKDSTLKAYEFYHAILARAPVIFTTTTQSQGGLRTWQELSRYPDIEVFGWSRGKPVNVTPLDPDETHATPDDVSSWGEPEEPEAKEILNMKLVAHKKIGRKYGA